MRITVGIVAMLFATTGFCFGQQKNAGKKVNSNTEVVVSGHPSTGIGKTEEVVGYPLDEKDEVKIHKSRIIDFKNESKKSEVKVMMNEDYNFLQFRINCNLDKGNVVVEIIDPKGEKQGTCTVKSDDNVVLGENSTTQEHVTGEIIKDFRYPLNGEWIIRASPSSAMGRVQIGIDQQYYRNLAR